MAQRAGLFFLTKSIGIVVRSFLTQRGVKKGDLSKCIEEVGDRPRHTRLNASKPHAKPAIGQSVLQ